VRGHGPDESTGLDQRVARIEDLLGLADAGVAAPTATRTAGPSVDAGAVVAIDDRSGPCAVAKLAGYAAWQDAYAKAKVNAGPAEAACADIRNDKKKQSCFYFATAETRATLAARDAMIAGGSAARDAVKNVKDDAKNAPLNAAFARARAASEGAFQTCGDDATP
jgi:hypothetical protein